MPTQYHSQNISPMRNALIEFARQINPTHNLTINFHDDYRPEVALARLKSWYRQVLQRLFGRRCYQLPREHLVEFVAFPEFTRFAGYPHFHCAARIPESHLSHFEEIAGARWKVRVPTGTLHLEAIQPTEDDRSRLLSYVTKSASAREVIHSSMLLPVT